MSIDKYQEHLDWIDTQSQHMSFLTESWSKINSGSYNLEGLQKMLEALEDNFLWLNGEMERIDLPPLSRINALGETETIAVGKALRIRKRPQAPYQIFLGGHMDTVFDKDHPFQIPNYLDENTLNGPGVADLKGGLVVMLKALEAVERSPWAEQLGYEIVLNPDEEIGSQSSDMLLAEAAKRNMIGLIYEPALADGTLAGERKGSGNFTFVIKGLAAHAGREFDKGRNAIVASAIVVNAINELNGKQDGTTINVGHIEGGGPLNMVPDLAIVRLNVRVPDDAARDWVQEQLELIKQSIFRDRNDYSIQLHGHFTRAPKPMAPANETLFNLVKESGQMLDLEVGWGATGGCCDGNNLWSHGLPNVDTLGVRGGNIHSDKEFVLLDSLPERAKLSALLLMRIASGEVTLPTKIV